MNKKNNSLVKVDVNLDGEALEPIAKKTNKVFEKISNATGIVFGVYKEKQKAKINFLSQINSRSDITDLEKLAITSNYKKILKEYENQNNIINKAIEIMERPIDEIKTESIDDGWIMNYMDCSKNICDEELQLIWAKILAGEFEQPGKYSLKTLEEMKKITKKDAKVFTKIAEYMMSSGNRYFIINNEKVLEKFNISFEDIILLDEMGFIKEGEKRLNSSLNKLQIIYNNLIVFFESKTEKISLPIYIVTEVGKEVFSLLKIEKSNIEFLKQIAETTKNQYKISYAEIINIKEGEITYKNEIIKLYEEDDK